MKKWIAAALFLLLMQGCALADINLELATDTLAVGSILDFQVEGEGAAQYRYALFLNGKEQFATGETAYGFGSYLPRKAGEYTLRAEALLEHGWETAEKDFIVTDALIVSLSPLPPSIQAGDGVLLEASPSGGSGQYRYLYTLALGDEIILEKEGAHELLWIPEAAGEYALSLLVTDGMGAFARAETMISVDEGPGISCESAGGQMLANGGQKAWIVYSPGPWQAETDCDYIRILKGEGESGELLILEIDEEAKEFRKSQVTLTSGKAEMILSVSQSAGYQVEEEISLFSDAAPLLADGQKHTLWLSAQGEREFTVQSERPWKAACDHDYIQLEKGEDSLLVSLDDWQGAGVRQGLITLENGDSAAYIHLYQVSEGEKKDIFLPEGPFPLPPEEDASFQLYSQCSGYWKDKKYRTSNLEKSGCAVFSLSHALQHLGYTGDEIRPEILAQTYAFALVQGGTMNDLLVGHAGEDFGFKTRYELYSDLPTIRSRMDQGAVYSFGIVTGHIAMIIEKSEDGAMFRVVDSAPSATWERIKNAQLFLRDEEGAFYPISDLSQIPGIRYYIETGSFGGATYWLEDSYIAKRGVRLIQPRQ